MITPRDLSVLQSLARYFVLNRVQIQRLCFPEDTDGRITRRRLLKLVHHNLINRQPHQMHDMEAGAPSSVYYPARRGLEILAEELDDRCYQRVSTQAPQPHHVRHWLAVSETHLAIDTAMAQQSAVQIEGWFNEWDTVTGDDSAAENRYRLYTLLDESPRLVCVLSLIQI